MTPVILDGSDDVLGVEGEVEDSEQEFELFDGGDL